MKRTLLSSLLSSVGLTAATIGGSLFDPSGAAIPNAKALLYNPDTAAKQETITAADGKFAFDNLAPGQYVLRVEKPGFAALFREFKVDADSKVERGLVLKVGSIHESVDVQSKGTAAAAQQPANPVAPAVITRNVLENPSWYTAYTPYQPEISQGRLEALINFQTMVTDLTGLDIANASMLDESTAVVEGMLLARRASKSTSNVFLVDADTLPQTKAVLKNRAAAVGIQLSVVDFGVVDFAESNDSDGLGSSGENYTGYQRTGNFASPGGAIPGQRHTYEIPGPLSLNH